MWSVILVAAGGGLGAVSRFGTSTLALKLWGSRFPYGTLLVNSFGSFLAGFLMILLLERFAVSDYWRLFFMVGFLGGFTTFSSFSWETWMLYQDSQYFSAFLNIILNNLLALGLAFLGMHFGRWIGGIY
ncbi:camphor resistance protein CrcB [Legionella birminghamensis]|uniref:Fluoride-specific ion channel FluC n=1 Tax=Legionella birminghamensis TaxID=28083 RepID=A0A378ICE4_9GAMM|nr:fluoride efflux transporter CrcB [Legionella birminghamensis]KTC75458.1 camphor resistance protein CrcB [Legionella birminghamensis]STX32683.1 camphor resistance [Legionella birminghamensis]